MTIEDFCKQYQDLTVSFVRDTYVYSSLKVTPQQRIFRVGFEIFQSEGLNLQKTYFSVSQKDKRFFGENSKYQSKLISFIIYRVEESGKKTFIAENSDTSRDVFKELDLTAGRYEVQIEIDEIDPEAPHFVLSHYSSKVISLDASKVTYPESNVAESLIDEVASSIDPKIHKNLYNYPDNSEIRRTKDPIANYILYVYQNNSEEKTLREVGALQAIEGLEIVPSGDYQIIQDPNDPTQLKYEISVPPKNTMAIKLK